MEPMETTKPSSLRVVLHSHAVELGRLLRTGQISTASVELVANHQKALRESFASGNSRAQYPLDVFAAVRLGKRVNFADKSKRMSSSSVVNAAKVTG
jgi:hypothetical protein